MDEQHNAHVLAYEREMDWRAAQRILGNGGAVVAECGTILGLGWEGDE